MDYKMLFIRAIKSGCLCSVLYHGFMLITGMAISLRQVVTFTVVFILLYFLWLGLVSKKNNRGKEFCPILGFLFKQVKISFWLKST